MTYAVKKLKNKELTFLYSSSDSMRLEDSIRERVRNSFKEKLLD